MKDASRQVALTIAGSDSGGGAGIQADLKTFAAFGCFGTSAVVAVTAQNTLGVRAVHPIPAAIVQAQLDALAEDLPPAACKTGMLATRELVLLVAETIAARAWPNYVLDPVMIATSGDALLDDDAVAAIRERLLPLTACVTPNLEEAARLTGLPVHDPETMERAGRALIDLGAESVLVKGGHLRSDILVDVFVTRAGTERFTRPRIATRAGHGTGCTLSAAITAQLALGSMPVDAIEPAIEYVQEAMRAAPGLGKGVGPLWHGRADDR